MFTSDAFRQELANILDWWAAYAPDPKRGGFYGQVGNDNRPNPLAPKGAVLHARILWTFAAACGQAPNEAYLALARRAYDYLVGHFLDKEHGGVYWSVDCDGRPLDTKKQIYALAFAIYGLTEYYQASGEPAALIHAQRLYTCIETHSFDVRHGGYLEALSRDWQPLADLRLSAKDANEKKSMNTHLHVLEAYAALYRVWPSPGLRQQLQALLTDFADFIIDPVTHHLTLFFADDWQPRPGPVSYGHDVEAAWLLLEAAEALGEPGLVRHFQRVAVSLAKAAAEGLATDGGLTYEQEPGGHPDADRHWWVQAEAVVGFYNAYQVSGEATFRAYSAGAWDFVRRYGRDRQGGEWYWGIRPDHTPMPGQDKAGFWKCPYHNGRACLEMLRRLG